MKNTYTIQGQSFVFNALFILVNLAGLTMVTIGFHESFEKSKWLFAGIGFVLLALSTGGLIVLKGRLFMSYVARVLVGGLFVVSGLIKANDPMGFAYKLEEYFEDGALAFRIKEWFGAPGFSLEWLIPFALWLSVIICIAEIVLGILVLIGGKIKTVSWLLVVMMLFFTFLTWHTANCDPHSKFRDRDSYALNSQLAQIKLEESKTNKDIKIISKNDGQLVVDEMKSPQCVSDCGCFGDAMKGSIGRSLTPSESLWKDIILLYLVVWIFITQRRIKPNSARDNGYIIPISLIMIIFFSYIFGWYFPVIFSIVAILAALWILRAGGKFLGNYWGSALIVTFLCLIMTAYVLRYEPIKDYRPYAVGSDLREKMNDGVAGVFETGFKMKNLKTGKEEFWSQEKYMDPVAKRWEDTLNFKYIDNETKEIKKGKLSSIDSTAFNPTINVSDIGAPEKKMKFIQEKLQGSGSKGVLLLDKAYDNEIEVLAAEYDLVNYDTLNYKFIGEIKMMDPNMAEIGMRDFILDAPTIFILFAKDLTKADFSEINTLKQINREAQKRNIPFIMVCSGSRADINKWRNENNFQVPVFGMDFIELKVVSRSNPSLMIVQNGIVKGKYPHRSLPKFDWIEKHVLNKK